MSQRGLVVIACWTSKVVASNPVLTISYHSSHRPRHPQICFPAFRVMLLMLLVCFKPISLFQMYHVIGLKQTCGIKNVTLKGAKKFVGVAVY